ncbi:MAG: trypsin-like peptidase domain-containing protein [Chitinophagaceae bacterium]|nr:trypsin-like peptidase domain-containing protein [Chitinophagaceae bacterium]
MPINTRVFLPELVEKLAAFDLQAASDMCDELIAFLYHTQDEFSTADGEKILKNLRDKRMFTVVQKVADALLQTGRNSHRIRRQYAQSLIDSGHYTAALCILQLLSADTNKPGADKIALKEYKECQGLVGRVYKQLYINANAPANQQNIRYLENSLRAYYEVYRNNEQTSLWHGINVLALLHKAKKDGVELRGYPEPNALAEKIFAVVNEKYADTEQQVDAWDFAIAAEACVALNRPEEAVKWLSGYVKEPAVDAFELSSTLRQLTEVWQLDMNSTTGKLVLPLMRAELLRKEGGNVLMNVEELKLQNTSEQTTTAAYKNLLSEPGENNALKASNKGLEKVFGPDSYNTYIWMTNAIQRGNSVARIGRDSSKGFGTGFLLPGKSLHEKLAEELVLITNAHVVNAEGAGNSLTPFDAVIIFEVLSRDKKFSASEIIWSSPSHELDTTILRFNAENLTSLNELIKSIELYSVAPGLPAMDASQNSPQRVYIIGHPAGGTLQFSFQDNLLLDYDDHKLHYRTPTVGGSSGSPVFNANWDLIGLHHAGRTDMPRLNGKEGVYEANEGIWIQSIKNKLKEVL